MTRHLILAATLLPSAFMLHGTADAAVFSNDWTPDEQRAEVRKVRDHTLQDLYRVQPDARKHIEKAAG